MRDTIERYVRNHHVCKRAKAARDAYNGLLQPLPVSERPWVDMTMDFVTGLPCTEENEGTLAEATAELFMRHVWSREGLPISMTSNRGPQFTAKMWNSLCKLLGIKAKLSTAWHPETDGQSEIANQEMERYLQSYVNHFQDDWVRLLPMAEFASNANTSASIRIPSFLAS